ncbi:hypothetical protein IFT73_17090 [Aeromicrobium sp. CFBP 8757]|uniref:hypothetical protein n=1 Tax=Aeromicrobium sp. CFBP 8757 TaxID=2775288 RepID=UPI001786BD7E|nr:hypothetical protein [Aeromicrobium sp. CFBP 8757]MBD8608573.1 hypothetical protein [Aeromicrobium sp. CFBP 8757]
MTFTERLGRWRRVLPGRRDWISLVLAVCALAAAVAAILVGIFSVVLLVTGSGDF